jgi:hypothetical protein
VNWNATRSFAASGTDALTVQLVADPVMVHVMAVLVPFWRKVKTRVAVPPGATSIMAIKFPAVHAISEITFLRNPSGRLA